MASTDNTLLDLYNSSYDTQPYSLIVNFSELHTIPGNHNFFVITSRSKLKTRHT